MLDVVRFAKAAAVGWSSVATSLWSSSNSSSRTAAAATLAFSTASTIRMVSLKTAVPYQPPCWAREFLKATPQHGRLHLANLPTPLYRVELPTPPPAATTLNTNFQLYIKRDDATGSVELSGNKVRKLEFLLADCLAQNCNAVVTIGGQQSNHCRATATAARMLGLQPHLILRTSSNGQRGDKKQVEEEQDLGLTGNLLIDRMVGSQIYTCTPGEYGRLGSQELLNRLCTHLESKGRLRPYAIPVGGSNGLGSWGYLQAVEELLEQWPQQQQQSLDHVVFACGSGGTAAGIALGFALAHYYYRDNNDSGDGKSQARSALLTQRPTVHAVGVCDDPDYFYQFVANIADQMGFQNPTAGDNDDDDESSSSTTMTTTEDFVRQHLVVHQGKGVGYAQSTDEELEFVMSFARDTGIVLDPVYSGKALYNFMQLVQDDPATFAGTNVLFWHTGGVLGLYDKCADLLPTLQNVAPCHRLDVYGKGNGVDLSAPSDFESPR